VKRKAKTKTEERERKAMVGRSDVGMAGSYDGREAWRAWGQLRGRSGAYLDGRVGLGHVGGWLWCSDL
jgi:hypothetical protein